MLPYYLRTISERSLRNYIVRLCPDLQNIPQKYLENIIVPFGGDVKDKEIKMLAIIEQKIYISLFSTTAIQQLTKTSEENDIITSQDIGDPLNLGIESQIGSNFAYLIKNLTRNISNQDLQSSAEIALSFLNEEPMVTTWSIRFEDNKSDNTIKNMIISLTLNNVEYTKIIDTLQQTINSL